MRNLILDNCRVLILVITAAEVILLIQYLRLYRAQRSTMVLCMALIDLGLIIDAAMIAAGVGRSVSVIRFVAHGLLIPLNLPVIGYACRFREKVLKVIWGLTLVLMVLGVLQGLLGDLEPVTIAGLTRYTQSDSNPAWIGAVSGLLSFGIIVPQLIAGLYVWIRQKTPFVFLSALCMYAFTALAPATGNVDLLFFTSMIGEVLMVLFYYLFAVQSLRARS